MLCLSTGSVCDVCLEPFDGDLKAPSAIECGHVFCERFVVHHVLGTTKHSSPFAQHHCSCLDKITRTSCPLCRQPYDPRRSFRLHVDIDGAPRVCESRPYFDRIASAVEHGCDESTVKHLVDECLAFVKDQPRSREFEDFRVVVRMFNHIYDTKVKHKQTKRKYRDEAARLQEELTQLKEDFQRERDAKALEIEKLNNIENGLWRDIASVRADYILMRKLVSDDNDALQEQLRDLRMGAKTEGSPPLKGFLGAPSAREDIKFKGSSLMDDGYFLSPLPDFEPAKLLPSPGVVAESLTSETSTPAIMVSDPALSITGVKRPPLPTPPSSARSPSLLSMTAPGCNGNQNTRSPDFFPNPIPPISVDPPRPHPVDSEADHDPSQSWTASSAPDSQDSVVYRQAGADRLRSRFMNIMHDNSPTITSSMPNLTGEHFPSDTPIPSDRSLLPPSSISSSRPVTSSRSLDLSSFDSPPAQPISVAPVKPIATITPSSSYSQASLAAAAMEDARRQRRVQEDERRRKDSERSREGKEAPYTPAASPPERDRALETKPGNDASRDGDRSHEARRPPRKQSSASGQQYPVSSNSGHQQAQSFVGPSPLGPHSQQESATYNKAYEGWSNNSTRSTSSSSKPPSATNQQLKGAATVGSTSPPRETLAYKPSTYSSSSMGPSKGRAMASSMLSNQSTSVGVV
ncbi:hypothetical protein PQX77_007484 [Marasmius sp. AFHP31]|nr:hypothetical protein PQX77_007484 [Marasmius sp. AFHP31]